MTPVKKTTSKKVTLKVNVIGGSLKKVTTIPTDTFSAVAEKLGLKGYTFFRKDKSAAGQSAVEMGATVEAGTFSAFPNVKQG